MLVVSRLLGERIKIGEDIFVSVERIDPGRVRLGIEAPRDIRIIREELPPLPGDGQRDGGYQQD